jgi:type 1 glutamine amidotransferase
MGRVLNMVSLAGVASLVAQAVPTLAQDILVPTDEQVRQMRDAAPGAPQVAPKAPRRILVWGHLYTHPPNPFAARALEVLGEKTGAFEAVVSQDPQDLLPDRLAEFDGLVMNNIHEPDPFVPRNFGELPKAEQEAARAQDAAVRESILDFVAGGKGLIGIHAATAALQGWAEYGEMMGGYYQSHIHQEVPIKLDEPDHPINACFAGRGFRINDEIYFLTEQHPREKYRVLLSLDLSQMDDPGKRADKDYPITWVRKCGEGRVFYCSLGHAPETYWNPLFLAHVLAGIQFALGDLEADATGGGLHVIHEWHGSLLDPGRCAGPASFAASSRPRR